MVSVKQSTIFSSLFFSKTGLEIMLSYGLERKEAFEDDKNVNFLNSEKWVHVFAKGVNPWFRQKIHNFSQCVFQQNRPRNNVELWSRKKRSF